MLSRNPFTAALRATARGARSSLKRLAGAAVRPFGLAIGSAVQFERADRLSYRRGLEHAKRLGLEPRTVIDVGVASGTWPLYEAFPNAHIMLVEPVPECRPQLERIASSLPRAEYVIAAASARAGTVVLHVPRDTARSSTRWESDFQPGEVTQLEVEAVTLDDLVRDRSLGGPFLLKADVQGGELDVLDGARDMLAETEYIILECCLFEFFAGGPLLAEVIAYMRARSFVTYDVLSVHHRPLDGAVSTLDLAFVKNASALRRIHRFQWAALP